MLCTVPPAAAQAQAPPAWSSSSSTPRASQPPIPRPHLDGGNHGLPHTLKRRDIHRCRRSTLQAAAQQCARRRRCFDGFPKCTTKCRQYHQVHHSPLKAGLLSRQHMMCPLADLLTLAGGRERAARTKSPAARPPRARAGLAKPAGPGLAGAPTAAFIVSGRAETARESAGIYAFAAERSGQLPELGGTQSPRRCRHPSFGWSGRLCGGRGSGAECWLFAGRRRAMCSNGVGDALWVVCAAGACC